MTYIKLNYFIIIFILSSLFTFPIFSQETEDTETSTKFRISQVRPEDSGLFVTFIVTGVFEERDILNLYINDIFINNTVVDTPEELAGIVEISRISEDKLPIGANRTIVKLQRDGIELKNTPVRIVNVRDRIAAPAIKIEASTENPKKYVITVRGEFREGSSLSFYNDSGSKIYQRTVESDAVNSGIIVIGNVSAEDLSFVPGKNTLRAEINIDNLNSGKGDPSNVITLPDPLKANKVKPKKPIVEKIPVKSLFTIPKCFEPSINTISQQGKGFGSDVSSFGNVLTVSNNSGDVFVYENNNNSLTFITKLQNDGTHAASNRYGVNQVVVNENEILVAAPLSSINGVRSGVVYQYIKTGTTWEFVREIVAPGLSKNAIFGGKIAVDGDLLVVSSETNGGSVHVFKKIFNLWVFTNTITQTGTNFDGFGSLGLSVKDGHIAVTADDGERVVVIFLYTQSGNAWNEEILIFPVNNSFDSRVIFDDESLVVSDSDASVYIFNGDLVRKSFDLENEEYGVKDLSISISGNIIAVGVPSSDKLDQGTGVVYLLSRQDGRWVSRGTFSPRNPGKRTLFGASVSVNDNNIYIGSPKDGDGIVYHYKIIEKTCVDDTVTPPKKKLTLNEERAVLENARETILSLIEQVTDRINQILIAQNDKSIPQKSYIVIDTNIVKEDVQRRIAVHKGLIGPQIPKTIIKVIKTKNIKDIKGIDKNLISREEVLKDSDNLAIPIYSQSELKLGSISNDVIRLQVFLNNNGYLVSNSGPGSPGNEVNKFDQNTEDALSLFQLLSGVPVSGVLDEITKNEILKYASL